MKLIRDLAKITGLLTALIIPVALAPITFAATSPSLGEANAFVILSDTYSNTVSGTTLNGALGYTTPPAVSPTVNGATHQANSVYNQAGIDQNNSLINLNNQPCSFSFAPGPIDLASDTTHGPVGVYTPGVYCATGSGSIGGGGTITLNGAGTYIFRMDGTLTTSAGSVVVLAGGASACDVWWTPTQATSLGANSTFVGTDIDAAGISIGSTVTWTGQALAFGGTVSTDTDTITSPTCDASRSAATSNPNNGNSSVIPGLPNTSNGMNVASFQWGATAVSILIALSFASIILIRRKSK